MYVCKYLLNLFTMELPSANNDEELRRKHTTGELSQVHYNPSQLHCHPIRSYSSNDPKYKSQKLNC